MTNTEYAGNYIYENNVLKQFKHSEGYVEPDGSSWQYVYRYVDIWGNTRLTYADDVVADGTIDPATEIRREQNYYPFGMEHMGYNYVTNGVENNLKTYQAQEFTNDLELNTHEWRFRMSDPAIGRFWQIDPLAEDYPYNSTYAFQENKLGMGTELEGAELNPFPWMVQDAATNPNGVGAHSIGITQGLANTVTGVVDAVTNPIQTAEGVGQLLDLGFTMRFGGTLDQSNINTMVGIGTAVERAIDDLANGSGIERGTVIGEIAGAVIGTKGATAGLKGLSATFKTAKIANPIPSTLARVVPGELNPKTLGAPGAKDVFVTAASDIQGLNATQIANKLTIPQSSSGFKVIQFNTPKTGLSSPINRTNPGFVGKGRTAGGAREFALPNLKISELKGVKLDTRF